MAHQLGEEGYCSSNGTYPFINNSLPMEESAAELEEMECSVDFNTTQSTVPSMDDHQQDVQCKEETAEKAILCSSTGAGISGEACALVVGSASYSLAEVYKLHGIRWKLCKKCGVNQQQQQEEEGSHDAQFESELVLGVDHCGMCKAKEQQQEMIKGCHSESNDDDRSARSDGSCIP